MEIFVFFSHHPSIRLAVSLLVHIIEHPLESLTDQLLIVLYISEFMVRFALSLLFNDLILSTRVLTA